MDKQIKSGSQILADFFDNLREMDNADKKVINVLVDLYKQDKLSKTNIINELEQLRKNCND